MLFGRFFVALISRFSLLGVFTLKGSNAKLIISNRDTESFCFELRFEADTCRWDFMGNSTEDADEENALCFLLNDFLKDDWSGTATELCEELKKHDSSFSLAPVTLSTKLNSLSGLLKKDYAIAFERDRSNKTKRIFLRRAEQ